jgi:hypothetical protein
MSTPATPATSRPTSSAGRIAALVFGGLLALVAAALLVGGIALVAAHLTQRDEDGFYTSSTTRLATSTYALTGEGLDLGNVRGGTADWTIDKLDATTRIRVTGEGPAPLFIGIAPERDVDAYLAGVPHERVNEVHHHGAIRYERVPGTRAPAAPGSQRFWVASVSGTGTQTLEWKPEGGRWSAVIMRADAAPGITADVSVGVRLKAVLWIGLALLALGLLAAAGATALLLVAARSGRATAPAHERGDVAAVAATHAAEEDASTPLRR